MSATKPRLAYCAGLPDKRAARVVPPLYPDAKPREIPSYCPTCLSMFCEHVTRAEVHLSPKELEVARLTGNGLNRNEIALVMGINIGVVQQYAAAIHRKLGLRDRVAVARWAWEHPERFEPKEPSV